ncbi:hypothetical protein EVAR_60203_1 [Eumeta japonica]|uniref:Uncharacterized protein n=1 Tax=Eumeta variegata TaxID=151549 RepID=A0A4C1ZBE5_EUMVA|nr:hypothetical protein EVAR_60203_1 [Eumeta japonica]
MTEAWLGLNWNLLESSATSLQSLGYCPWPTSGDEQCGRRETPAPARVVVSMVMKAIREQRGSSRRMRRLCNQNTLWNFALERALLIRALGLEPSAPVQSASAAADRDRRLNVVFEARRERPNKTYVKNALLRPVSGSKPSAGSELESRTSGNKIESWNEIGIDTKSYGRRTPRGDDDDDGDAATDSARTTTVGADVLTCLVFKPHSSIRPWADSMLDRQHQRSRQCPSGLEYIGIGYVTEGEWEVEPPELSLTEQKALISRMYSVERGISPHSFLRRSRVSSAGLCTRVGR